jgi:hypothetical protein
MFICFLAGPSGEAQAGDMTINEFQVGGYIMEFKLTCVPVSKPTKSFFGLVMSV